MQWCSLGAGGGGVKWATYVQFTFCGHVGWIWNLDGVYIYHTQGLPQCVKGQHILGTHAVAMWVKYETQLDQLGSVFTLYVVVDVGLDDVGKNSSCRRHQGATAQCLSLAD